MIVQDIKAAMSRSAYPGRGIVAGKSADGGRAILVYFIMGRSENSRNRVFTADGDGIRTEAHDETKMQDPSLIIYRPVRVLGRHTIVTNGDQTDTIYEHLESDGTFESALRTRTFEPDAPNFTPRISAMATTSDGDCSLKLSILKATDLEGVRAARYFFEYDSPVPGVGHFIHTYREDGDPLPSFAGEPEQVALIGDLRAIANDVWSSLDADNRVSLWARSINLTTGDTDSLIINRHAEGA